jgi:hypothetical protein
MTRGMAQRQGDLLDDIARFCDAAVRQDGIYAPLHRDRDWRFAEVHLPSEW